MSALDIATAAILALAVGISIGTVILGRKTWLTLAQTHRYLCATYRALGDHRQADEELVTAIRYERRAWPFRPKRSCDG